MGRQGEGFARRLRRLARMLVLEPDSADALVAETLGAAEERGLDISQLFAILIARRRQREDLSDAGHGRGIGRQPDITRGFEALPLAEREVLALIVVERLPYDEAARILGLGTPALMARLTKARAGLSRQMERDPKIVLRLVK